MIIHSSGLRAAGMLVTAVLLCTLVWSVQAATPTRADLRVHVPFGSAGSPTISFGIIWPQDEMRVELAGGRGHRPGLGVSFAAERGTLRFEASTTNVLSDPLVSLSVDHTAAQIGADLEFALSQKGGSRITLRGGTEILDNSQIRYQSQWGIHGWESGRVAADLRLSHASLAYALDWTCDAESRSVYTLDVPPLGLGVTRIVSRSASGLSRETSWHVVDMPLKTQSTAEAVTVPSAAVAANVGHLLVPVEDTICGSCSSISPAANGDNVLDFGEAMTGETVPGGFAIRCTRGVFCWLDSISAYPSTPFRFESAPFGSTVINGQTARVNLSFVPAQPGEYSDFIEVRWCYAYWVEWVEPEFALTIGEMEGYYTARCMTLHLPLAGTALAKPEAAFSYQPDAPICGRDVTFDGSGSHDPNPGGEIVSYSWVFDDADPVSGLQPTHRFSTAGEHEVTLTVTNSRGMTSDPVTQMIDVSPDLLETAAVVGAAAAAGWASQAMALAAPALAVAAPGVALAVTSVIAEAGMAAYPMDQLVIRFPESWSAEDVRQLIQRNIPGARVIGSFSTLKALLIQFPLTSESPEAAQDEIDAINATLNDILPPGAQLGKNYIGRFEGQTAAWHSTASYDVSQLEAEFRVAYDAIRAPEAWDRIDQCSLKLRPVRVAVVDTGIDASHEEFVIPLRGKSYVAEEEGECPWFEDPDGHGSQISGIIGAQNGRGRINGLLASCAGNYEMQVYRVRGDMFSVWDGARLAASRAKEELDRWSQAASLGGNRKSVVMNISLGWNLEALPPDERMLARNTFLDLFDGYPSTLFVSSAGNGDVPDHLGESTGKLLKYGGNVHAPGGLCADNNLTVAATNAAGTELMSWSNYGAAVDLAAPGHEVFTSDRNGNYTWRVAGTSYAAAMVSGVAAAVLSIDPSLSPAEVKSLLMSSPSRVEAPDGSMIPVLDYADAVDKAIRNREDRIRRTWWWSSGMAVGVLGLGYLVFKPF